MTETSVFETALLPDAVKEEMCRGLLAEFGATRIRVRHEKGELEHCCVLPWHDESRPSASLNYKKLVYNCLSCNSYGGLLWFIAACRGIPGPAAREWLERESCTGPDWDAGTLLAIIDAMEAAPRRGLTPIPRMSERAIAPWMLIHPYLTDPVDAVPKGRGVPRENVRALRVGYAERFPLDDQGRTGERVVFPHFWRGDLVGWQSRRLYDDGSPKYLSTGEFPAGRTIYNYDASRRIAVVVESPMSVLRHTHHLPIEATFGSEVTDAQVRLIAEHKRVVLWMDNDDAGWKAVQGAQEGRQRRPGLIDRLTPYTDVWVVDSPWAADPGDMDDLTVAELYAGAVPACLWQPPKALRCWFCKSVHDGHCP